MKAYVVCEGAEEVSPDTHIYVGMFRPPFSEIGGSGAAVVRCFICGLGHTVLGSIRFCWDAGHFDYPVYKRIDDLA